MLNVSSILETNAREFPDKTAIIAGDWRLTYNELNEAANQVANGLCAAGIRKGEKVAFTCPTNPFFPICYYGIMKTGAVAVPLNPLFKRDEVSYRLSDFDCVAYICFEGTEKLPMGREGWVAFEEVTACKDFWLIPTGTEGRSLLSDTKTWSDLTEGQPVTFDTLQTQGDDTCCIIYTSGTSGRPKGAEWSHTSFLTNALLFRDHLRFNPDDTALIAMPLFHLFGQSGMMNPALCAGSTLVLLPRFEPGKVWPAIQYHNVTVYAGVPTMYWNLYNYPDLDSLDLVKISKNWRVGICGGAPLPVELLENFQNRFNMLILQAYGTSEVSPAASNRFGKAQKPGSVGFPMWGAAMRLVDEGMKDVPVGERGEIVFRGHNVMKGYYKKPEANKEAFRGGWFHTGDIGTIDEDGYLYLVDRKKDVIIRGGENIYPSEVEETLMRHPDISLAAVIGIPDEKYGEQVKAYVILENGSTLTPEEIIAWARQQMAAYAYPRYVEIRDSLPLGGTSKVLKSELRKSHASTARK